MSDLRLVIFDCDGTLVDSQHLIADTMIAAYDRLGVTPPRREAIRRITGLSLEVAIAQLTPSLTEQDCHDMAAAYREHFHMLRARGDMNEPLFPEAKQMLQALDEAGYLMAITTLDEKRKNPKDDLLTMLVQTSGSVLADS